LMRQGCLLVGLALFRGTHALPNGLGKLPQVTATGRGSGTATTLNTHDQHLMASCSPQKACDFVKKLATSTGGDPPLSLICTAAENCTISGTQLGGENGLQTSATMAHVRIQNNKAGGGALLSIHTGSVVGTKLTFRNGQASSDGVGGCVFNYRGNFTCTDCVFDKCSSGVDGGAIFSYDSATLKLVRPTFTDDTCAGPTPCGAGCACGGRDASKCVGCTCKKHSSDGFYCDSTEAMKPEGTGR